jgi:hypothetical protein
MSVTNHFAPSLAPVPTPRHRHPDAAGAPQRPSPTIAAPLPASSNPKRGKVRQNAVVLVTASAMGLWLAFAAPSVSPAAPSAPAATASVAAPVIVAPAVPEQPDPNGRRGDGRR